MRKTLAVVIALAVSPLAVHAAPQQTITLDIQNMTCAVCPITVKKSLERVSGVSDVGIDFKAKTARVTYNPSKTKPADLIGATRNAGYPSTVRTRGWQ